MLNLKRICCFFLIAMLMLFMVACDENFQATTNNFSNESIATIPTLLDTNNSTNTSNIITTTVITSSDILIVETSEHTEASNPYSDIINATEQQALLHFWSLIETEDYLLNKGFSSEEIHYISSNCVINWNTNAINKLEQLLYSTDLPNPNWVKEWLKDVDLFTEEQVNYAINNYLFDWKQAAVICANQYIDTLWMTPKDLKDEILFLGFTMEEALYAIDHCDIDWNSCAKWIAKDIFRGNEYGREEILEYLQNICEFTFEQALWGVENGEFDYNKETNNNTSNNSSLLETTSTTSEKQVWISDSGSKYHNNAGCSNMKNPSQIPLSKAKQLGYEPCKRCH